MDVVRAIEAKGSKKGGVKARVEIVACGEEL